MLFRTKYLSIAIVSVLILILTAALYFVTKETSFTQEAGAVLALVDVNDNDFTVEEVVSDPDTVRQKRLKELAGKIAQMVIPKIEEPEVEIVESEEIENSGAKTIKLCSNHRAYGGFWSASGLSFEVVEGARLLLRESVAETSSEVILQLPLFTSPFGGSTCLSTDVAGIALDGSLIRNSDYKVYSIFGNQTLVGYALDGFPIYGLDKNSATDSCGGTIVDGQYRYYLNANREGVIGCFSGTPVAL